MESLFSKYQNSQSILLLIVFVAMIMSVTSCGDGKKSDDQANENKPPNIILVITDDQGYGDLGHTGNPIIQTPALDRFSGESLNLTNYHVGTTCSPTRAGLLTGRNCNRNGVWHTIMGASILNEDEVTIANVLNENGYKTGMFGKWHLGDNHPFLPHDRGFDESFYHGGGGVAQTPDYWKNDYFDDTYFRNGVPEKTEGYCTDVWFQEAMKFIEDKKDDSFFCYLSLNAPHWPFNVPEEYYNKYKNETEINEVQKRFYGMITNIDDNFQKLLAKVDQLGIANNTIVIFTTDNGTARGYMKQDDVTYGYNVGMRGTKASEYDGGHRVPFIIRWPDGKIGGGSKLDGLIAHVDMLPTLTTLASIDFNSTKQMDGTDVSAYINGKSEAPERMLVTDTQRVPWPVKGKQSCVMDGNWRLVNGDELYDISSDPGQENNIASTNPDRVESMNVFYGTWWEDVIKETKFSIIKLGVDQKEVLTCHDAKIIDHIPPWNQEMVRAGKPMKPAPFSVNFTKSGKYRFSLSRYPPESKLALGVATQDGYEETAFTDGSINGKAMKFSKAYLKIGETMKEVVVDNNAVNASLEMDVESGETELLAYFDMEDGTQSNAFYVEVEKIN